MKKEIIDFISLQKVCVLAVEMLDGSPHAATVHFAYTDDPFVFYFETDKNYRKSEALFGRKISRASMVVGTYESSKQTFQMDGEVRLIENEELDFYNKVYFSRFPEKVGKFPQETKVRFMFTPKWWRFTDWTSKDGKKILLSTDK